MSTNHPRPAEPARQSLKWPRVRRWLILSGVLVCVGFLLGQLWGRHQVLGEVQPRALTKETGAAKHELVGRWGTLEVVPIEIERPNAFINATLGGEPAARWLFPGVTTGQLEALFQQPDLTPAQQAGLLDKGTWEQATNGIAVRPGTDLILGLSPAARARLYFVLGTNSANPSQRWPIMRRKSSVDDWLARSGLSDTASRLVRSLLYEQGPMVAFADTDAALNELPASHDRFRLLKTLSRQPTLLAKLRIREGEDVAPLVNYWGRGGRAKDVQPLLESLARVQGGALLDLAHVLPPLARMKIYTYPFPSDDPAAGGRDCAWTALNFFAEEPDERPLDQETVHHTIQRRYYPVQDEPQFGDIVCFMDREGNPIHVAVHLAAGLLFTKNGATFHAPWVVMRLDDVVAAYTTQEPPRVRFFRDKRL